MKGYRCISSLTPEGGKQRLRHRRRPSLEARSKTPAGSFVGGIWGKGSGWSPGRGQAAQPQEAQIGWNDDLGGRYCRPNNPLTHRL